MHFSFNFTINFAINDNNATIQLLVSIYFIDILSQYLNVINYKTEEDSATGN